MKHKHYPTILTKNIRYIIRTIKRVTRFTYWLFFLFLTIMFVVWATPKIINWALR